MPCVSNIISSYKIVFASTYRSFLNLDLPYKEDTQLKYIGDTKRTDQWNKTNDTGNYNNSQVGFIGKVILGRNKNIRLSRGKKSRSYYIKVAKSELNFCHIKSAGINSLVSYKWPIVIYHWKQLSCPTSRSSVNRHRS